ncbi:hypothetical protein GCM10011514_40990 [Emticicia aquatilis]|uniref:Uncharacterized protein n=1 Tax=Emticicia aquatilis TaxID=1537369 RepID=A0A916Z1V4_9BACT|nr:hypothetical protein [Emticicia aquatilis]GGD72693.1 hypothetical protein GCM10011514_40990 [Emticicia aquatilis]
MKFDLLKIKNILETQVCSVHNQIPNVSIIDDKIQTIPCCENFGVELSKIAEQEYHKQADLSIQSMLDEFQAKFQ